MSTKLSMKNPNPGIWFKFDEKDPESGDIGLRPLNGAKREELRKKAVKTREKFKHGQRFEIEEVNEDLHSQLFWDYVITGWNNLVDDDGNPIECTTENKVFLMKNHIGFSAFVSEKLGEISEGYEEKLSLENENLLPGSSGSGTRTNQVAKTAEK